MARLSGISPIFFPIYYLWPRYNIAHISICSSKSRLLTCKDLRYKHTHTHTHTHIYIYTHTHTHICVLCLVALSCQILHDPMDYSSPGSFVHGDSPGNNTGVGCYALLQGIFPTQESNLYLLHWHLPLSQPRSPQEPMEEGKSQVPAAGAISFVAWMGNHPQQSDWFWVWQCFEGPELVMWPCSQKRTHGLPAMMLSPSVRHSSPSQKYHQEHFTILAAIFNEVYFIIWDAVEIVLCGCGF